MSLIKDCFTFIYLSGTKAVQTTLGIDFIRSNINETMHVLKTFLAALEKRDVFEETLIFAQS